MNTKVRSNSEPQGRLLIVDDEAAHTRALCDTLGIEGYATTGFEAASTALEAMQGASFDLLLTDLMMPEMDGVALLRAAQKIDPDIVGIVMTGHGAIDTAVKAMQAGACDYIVKPFRMNHLLPVITRALETRRLRRLNKELERRILERTRELEVANRDLEAFSYSVSHDLHAPLRGIRGLCDMLIDECGPDIPAKADALLKDIQAGAARMGQLIEDLLTFARSGRASLNVAEISMNDLVREILGELKSEHQQRCIELELQDLPSCCADPALLKQVLVNLLSNAFKFTSGRDVTRIELGSYEVDGQQVYFVKDNGAGFDMKFAAKLFGVFQRLHSQSEFMGTGVGLSIVQRIVERHGGKVWAEGRPAEGATFYFALPLERTAVTS
jgi:two-component system, sensor histidine kinase and response regulator